MISLRTRAGRPTHEALADSSVWHFFVCTFSMTFAVQLPALLAQRGLLGGGTEAYLPLAMLGVFAPLVAATWLTWRSEGRVGVQRLYRGLLAYRVNVVWYAIALALPGVLLWIGCALLRSAGHPGDAAFVPAPANLMVALLISLGEEVGWRGFALPRLIRQFGAIGASGILGVLWTVWHIPMFVGLGISLEHLPVLLLQMLGGSLLFTWIYQRTQGSLLLAVLAHCGAHVNNSHRALPDDALPLLVHAIVYAAIGMAAVALDKRAFPDRLTAARRPRER